MIKSTHIEENNISENPDMLPVILTCPHNGDFVPAGVPEREDPGCKERFSLKGDAHTTTLTNEIADNIYRLCKKHVYVEIGLIKRNRCDLNRSPECAYEKLPAQHKLPALLCYYRYHNSILTKIKEIQHQNYFNHKLGILIDIHGFLSTKKHPADIIIGTENEETLKAASQLNIDIKWDHTNGFLTCLKKKRYYTDPVEPGNDNENPEFKGGPTVENAAKQVNFIGLQLEVASRIRSISSDRIKLGKDVASTILKTLDLVKI
jgi:N-formylglutamate amidohydrolase